ncbi:hypothetical protein GOBAR_AA35073 [Gossypium barbadense]|uniref:Uncharacterized protein n=1 Tax=Gossypium barbadense TaxID=3634 RepID=A0A2P5W3J3_GOSBA|nr:hypothetical protein GOBAR_AA35073 [Gossypium barbadense]
MTFAADPGKKLTSPHEDRSKISGLFFLEVVWGEMEEVPDVAVDGYQRAVVRGFVASVIGEINEDGTHKFGVKMELDGAKLTLPVEDGRVNFNFGEVDGYGGNLGDHDATKGVGHGGVNVVEA